MTSTVGQLERALAEHRARRRLGHVARRHPQVRLPREDVDRVRVDEAAVVVADVDDDAVARVILGVEIDVQLIERGRAHVDHVHVAEPAAARLAARTRGCARPTARYSRLFSVAWFVGRTTTSRVAPPRRRSTREHDASIDRVGEQLVEIHAAVPPAARRRPSMTSPTVMLARERRRPERHDVRRREAARPVSYVARDRSAGRAGRSPARRRRARDAEMRRVQVADHQAHHAPQLVRRRRRRGARAVDLARRFPVHAVERGIEEVVAQQRPRLAEHLQLLGREVDGELRGDVERPRRRAARR